MNLMSLSPSKQKTGRLLFIDFTRGIVMVLMYGIMSLVSGIGTIREAKA
jgi:uncharacterized membrane protein